MLGFGILNILSNSKSCISVHFNINLQGEKMGTKYARHETRNEIEEDRERILDLQEDTLRNMRNYLMSETNGPYIVKERVIWPEETGCD